MDSSTKSIFLKKHSMISDLVLFRGRAEEHLGAKHDACSSRVQFLSFNSMTTRVLVVMKLGRSESSMMISRLGEYTVDHCHPLSSVSVVLDLPGLGFTLP